MTLIDWLDALAIVALGLSGGALALRKGMDFYGAMVLAVVTAIGGGVISDVLIGEVPRALRVEWIPVLAALSGLVAYFVGERLKGWVKMIAYLDAVGLGLYAIAGAQRGLKAELGLVAIVLLGVLTGSGGGMMRDVLAGEIPYVLRREIYALAAAAGALAFGLAVRYYGAEPWVGFACAALVTAIRIGAVRLGIDTRVSRL
jgi:uncharacterized membrane protein YeiH